MQFQWYPGHMTKAKRAMQEDLKLIDVIIELVDARVPLSSKNPDIDQLANGKSRIILMNKYDLADPAITEKWIHYYEEKGYYVTKVNSKNGNGVKAVHGVIQEACKAKIERDRRRGILNRPIRAMIVGIPNVGKSTFINSFAKKACAKTGNKPGVTKGKQWIRLNKNVELLDTPGILWPKFEDPSVGFALAVTGAIKEDVFDREQAVELLLDLLIRKYPQNLQTKYAVSLEQGDDVNAVMAKIAVARGCLKSGGQLDLDKVIQLVLRDFRAGRLGRFTIDEP